MYLKSCVAPLIACMTAAALAQPAPPTAGLFSTPPSVTLYASLYLKDAALRKELKVTPEQAPKLDKLADVATRPLFAAQNADKRAAVIEKQDEALAAVLTPPQVERLRQVVRQHLARIPAGPAALASDEDVVRVLKLDDAQKKRMLAREPLAGVLTDGQKKEWATLIGKPYPARLRMTPYGMLAVNMPFEVLRLLTEPMEAELKLTPKQLARLEDLTERWADEFPDISYQAVRKLDEKTRKDVRGILAEAQRKRLDQIELQDVLRNTTSLGRYDNPKVAAALKLTAAQKEAQWQVRREHVEDALKTLEAGGDSYALREKLVLHRKTLVEGLKKVLTDEQRAALRDLIGEEVPPAVANPYVPQLPWERRDPLPPTYLTLELLAYRGLAFNLGLVDAEGYKKLAALKSDRPADESEVDLAARAEALEKEFAGIVKPEQMKRWKQAVLGWLGPNGRQAELTLMSCVDVRKTLGLTDAQMRRLYRGAAVDSVFDPKQKEKWAELTGQNVPRPAVPTVQTVLPIAPSMSILWTEMRIVGDPSVIADLKLTPEQKAALEKLAKERRASFPKPQGADYYEQASKHLEDSADKVAKLLDEKQKRRLRQISLQQRGASQEGLRVLVTIPEAVRELKLTTDQVKRISALVHHEPSILSMIEQVTKDPANRFRAERERASAARKKRTDEQFREILSEEQQTALKGLPGEPFQKRIDQISSGFLP